jgi:hypothetical protein
MIQQTTRRSIVWEEDPFSGPREVPLPLHARMSPERILAYAQALETRCHTLWAYLQDHEVATDPVVHLLAETLEVTESGEPIMDLKQTGQAD